MSEILQLVITSLISIIGTGGIGSIVYFKLQKRAKEAEVKAVEVDVKTKEITNLSASNEEWIKLYNNCLAEKEKLREVVLIMSDKITEVQKQKDSAWEKYSDCRTESNKKDLVISELNWYRCEVNGCPYRRPPRKYGEIDFPKDGVVHDDDQEHEHDSNTE